MFLKTARTSSPKGMQMTDSLAATSSRLLKKAAGSSQKESQAKRNSARRGDDENRSKLEREKEQMLKSVLKMNKNKNTAER